MAYGRVWQWDSDATTFYRTGTDGKKITYDKEVLDDTNCYGTYLNKYKSKAGVCKRVIECLADGDAESLSSCMDILNDKDLWTLAADDVENVNPISVKAVLRKFGVMARWATDDDGKKYKVPMSYDEWKSDVLVKMDKPTKTAIENNSKLLSYLQGLLSVTESNPAIINKFQPKLARRGMGPRNIKTNYVVRLNKNLYYDPRESTSPYAIMATQLRALPYGTLAPTLFSPRLGSLNNASFYSNIDSAAMLGGAYSNPQTGGNFNVGNKFMLTKDTRLTGQNLTLKDGSGNIFESLFKVIDAGLSDMGIAMDATDAKRIEAAIKKIKEIEQKLIAIVRRLSIAVRIGETLGAHHFVGDRQNVAALPLDTVRTNADARNFMESHVRELRDAYEGLHGHYTNITSDLAGGIFPRFLDRCCEKKADPKAQNWIDLSEPC